MTTLIEATTVGPPPAAHRTLPLTFLDLCWLHFHPIRRLFFYDFPFSKSHFLESFVPKLKHSLSLALELYFPLAGTLIYPSDTENYKPTIHYSPGDSVPFPIYESSAGGEFFELLVSNQPREADAFYDYTPQLPPVITEPDRKLLRLLAVRVTLFPGRGVCIGVTNHHSAGDASSIVGFVRAWASACKSGSLENASPVFDRGLIVDPSGRLESAYWDQMKQVPFTLSPFPLPTKRVRATYVLDRARIEKLKDSVVAKSGFPGLDRLSSFVVASAHVWTCLAKSLVWDDENEEKRVCDDDEVDFFLFAADIRARLSPPLPGSYFGNCLTGGLAKVRHEELIGPGGLFVAAQAIADEIKDKLNGTDRIMGWLENIVKEITSIGGKRMFSVSGSARVDLYGADFGLGRARKVEALSIDGEKYSMSLCRPRDCEDGLEIGLSLSKAKMDVFASLFEDGLE
ncbi:Coumaroyl-CoA\\x3aanthocyanidin 3-O-glucoside-6-O-coumaroyltransferase 2 [Striga hermonthica]|uniref:Coumaroyl-CoA\x3aanthocyanidin 3-O-glucoside-6-O-coumaroyltransferase 2 n=1 Tax=Striga hermonthica TaxID=68872 RepID=A0A9N7NKA7_STRHE|nr:Coumaroyl-CoA\\x3aanthocyanidin 3-O-glucoside-6-O-coumaroyltransferase 2 [Striga hermonthica]